MQFLGNYFILIKWDKCIQTICVKKVINVKSWINCDYLHLESWVQFLSHTQAWLLPHLLRQEIPVIEAEAALEMATSSTSCHELKKQSQSAKTFLRLWRSSEPQREPSSTHGEASRSSQEPITTSKELQASPGSIKVRGQVAMMRQSQNGLHPVLTKTVISHLPINIWKSPETSGKYSVDRRDKSGTFQKVWRSRYVHTAAVGGGVAVCAALLL